MSRINFVARELFLAERMFFFDFQKVIKWYFTYNFPYSIEAEDLSDDSFPQTQSGWVLISIHHGNYFLSMTFSA